MVKGKDAINGISNSKTCAKGGRYLGEEKGPKKLYHVSKYAQKRKEKVAKSVNKLQPPITGPLQKLKIGSASSYPCPLVARILSNPSSVR